MPNEQVSVRARATAERERAVALRKRSRALRHELTARVDAVADRGDGFTISLPRLPSCVALARSDLRRWLERHEVAQSDILDIVLALSEACANAVEHPHAAHRQAFEVRAQLNEDEVQIEVRDFGRWTSPARRGSDDLSGRGLLMIRALMDDVDVVEDPAGTTIMMRRRTGAATPPAQR